MGPPVVAYEEEEVVVTWRLPVARWRLQGAGLKWTVCALLTVLALWTRLYNIHLPPSVAWDETHFGKFVNEYLHGTFYFDVHPPLAKMLLAVAGYWTGYEGDFSFEKPGMAYDSAFQYVGMRTFCALLGTAVVTLSYLTVYELVPSVAAASFAASLLIFDTSVLTISRFILLDPVLMFFISASLFCCAKWRNERTRAFSDEWWLWLFLTGAALGCAISCKFVGLFIVLLVGAYTASSLWDLLGDLNVSLSAWTGHFLARAVCLILLPIFLYLMFFFIHFSSVAESGSGEGFMSSAFQSTLLGNALHGKSQPNQVAYDSIVTIKNFRYGGGYLHSHPHLYPKPLPEQQQITTYMHKDDNNKFRIKRAEPLPDGDHADPEAPVQLVRSGEHIRLEHISTRRNLHGHRHKAPITTEHFQVTGYGQDGVGDVRDVWVIQLAGHVGAGAGDPIGCVDEAFRLLHTDPVYNYSTCALHSSGKRLPKWGFEQNEVSCSPDVGVAQGNLWNFEAHINPRLPVEDMAHKESSFFSSLVELHVGMLEVNSGFIPKEGEVTSQAWHWPLNYMGQPFTAWGAGDRRVYLLGNPLVFAVNLLCLLAFPLLAALHALCRQRGIKERTWEVEFKAETMRGCGWLYLAWALHYFPFFLMDRVVYFHHYMPAVVINCMLSGILMHYALHALAQAMPSRGILFYGGLALLVALVWSFEEFRMLSYGMMGPLQDLQVYQWLPMWRIAHW